jgi:hypothetical protein
MDSSPHVYRDALVEQKLQELRATQKAFSRALSSSQAPKDVPQEEPQPKMKKVDSCTETPPEMADSDKSPPKDIDNSDETLPEDTLPEGITVVGDVDAKTPAAKTQPRRVLPMSVQYAALSNFRPGGAMPASSNYSLSPEQQAAVDAALEGRNIFLTGQSPTVL